MGGELPEDIRQQIVDDFGLPLADAIYHYLLDRIPEGLANGSRQRHLRCIIYLANGDRNRLEHFVEACLLDTRDVMLGAEYDSQLVRKRDFNKPFDQAEL